MDELLGEGVHPELDDPDGLLASNLDHPPPEGSHAFLRGVGFRDGFGSIGVQYPVPYFTSFRLHSNDGCPPGIFTTTVRKRALRWGITAE